MASTTIKLKPASGSTNGRGIKIAATSTPGTTLHTAVASTTDGDIDYLEVDVYNSDTTDRVVKFEVGGTTAPDDIRGGNVPAGETRKFTGFILRNSLVLKAFCATTNVLIAHVKCWSVVYA